MPPKKEYIIAPAGHGKTEEITRLVDGVQEKKALVLTHTNAGVNSLVKRFKRNNISYKKYDISTIDSFAVRYSRAYPSISGVNEIPQNSNDYELCRLGAIKVFEINDFQEFLSTRYSLVIVDEYQDCNRTQHDFILMLSEHVDCIILGDPMQGIFDIGGDVLIDWEEVRQNFEMHETELHTPYRWHAHNEELGVWMKDVREKLEGGMQIRLEQPLINFINATNHGEIQSAIFDSLNDFDEVLLLIKDDSALGSAKKQIAQSYNGRLQVVDSLDFKLLSKFLDIIENKNGEELFSGMMNFFSNCMTKTNLFKDKVERKLRQLWSDTPPEVSVLRLSIITVRDTEQRKKINSLYQKFINVFEYIDMERVKAALALMEEIQEFIKNYNTGERGYIYRRDVWDGAKNTFARYIGENGVISLAEEGQKIRQRISFVGRSFNKIIGTTLLTKGLEFNHVIILKPENLNTKNLYVALSRAKKKITIIGECQNIRKEIPDNL